MMNTQRANVSDTPLVQVLVVYVVFYADQDNPYPQFIGVCSSLGGAKACAERHWQLSHDGAVKWWEPDFNPTHEHIGEPAVRYEIPHTIPMQYVIKPYRVND